MLPATCPSPEELATFHAGTLVSIDRLEKLAVHLESCAACLAFLQSRPDDTPWGRSSTDESWTRVDFSCEPQLQAALACIAAIPQQIDARDSTFRIGEYEFVERLGSGGMGTVYKSWHPRLQRPVVLKLIRARSSRHPAAIEQFRDEMSALGRLDHPLIVKAYDAQEFQGLEYLVMEYVAGNDLRELVRRNGPFSPADACAIVHEIALGLEHLHERQMVHRDIKPSNVALGDDRRVKILDLGLALSRTVGCETATTADSLPCLEGTIDFMAPEQALDSRAVTPAADLYSLGATFYFLIVGESPWAGLSDRDEKLLALRNARRINLDKLPPRLPRRVRSCLERLLAHRPEERPSTAREVAETLRPMARASSCILLTQDNVHSSCTRQPRPWLVLAAIALLAFAVSVPLGRSLWPVSPSVAPSLKSSSEDTITSIPPVTDGTNPRTFAGTPGNRPEAHTTPLAGFPQGSSLAGRTDRDLTRPKYKAWRIGSSSNQLTGLAHSPPLFEGFARWQVETVRPRGFVQALAISPDARHFALASQEGAVRIFAHGVTPESTRLVRLLPQEGSPTAAPRSLAWSPNGKWLAVAVADGDRPIGVWDWQTSKRVHELRGHVTGVTALAWRPSGHMLASAGRDGCVRLWDATGLVRHTIEVETDACTSLAWHPEGTSLAVGDDAGGVSHWMIEGQSSPPRAVHTGGRILAIAWQPSGKELAMVTEDHVLHVHDPVRPEVPSLRTHIPMPFRSLVWSKHDETLFVVTDGGPLRWDRNREELTTFASGPRSANTYVAGVWADAIGSLWLASMEGKVQEVSSSGVVKEVLDMPRIFLRDLVWNRDSTRLAVCSVDGCIQIWGGQGRPYGVLRGREPIPAGIRCAAWSGDGKYLAAAELAPRSLVHVWDVEARQEIATWPTGTSNGGAIDSLAWSDDGLWLVAVGAGGMVRTWSVRDQRAGPSPDLHRSNVHCVSNCPHTRRFASSDAQGTIQIWEIDATGEIRVASTWTEQREPAWSLAWSPSGDRLGATGAGQQAWVLDVATGQEIWSIGCPIPPGRIMWKQDGQRVFVNGGGVRDARDGKLLAAAFYLEPAAYSPDGRWIAEVSPTQLVTVRHAGNLAPAWRGVPVGVEAHVTFASSGQIIYQSHSFEDSLVYVVEPRRGDISMLRPSEFEQRVKRRISK